MTLQTAPRLRAAVLGPVLVDGTQGELVEPPGTLAKSLIAALVLARGPLSVRGIVDDLWADTPPRNEKAALQTLVSRMRAASADGLIASTGGGYALSIAADESDLGRAVVLRDRARAARSTNDWPATERAARAALALWRGEPGADLGSTELSERVSELAAQLRDELMRLTAAACVELGDTDGALSDLAELLTTNPLDDDLHALQMTALTAAGRRNDALRAFVEYRTLLRERLGTDPSPVLVELNARLLREADRMSSAVDVVHVGLRTAPNELVGRAGDIEAIEALMRTSRVTTILGAGGLGKTRLAQEIAGRAADHTPGVYVVELASVRTGDDLPLVLASTLGIREFAGARLTLSDPGVRVDVRTRILAALRERPTLLVVDNCEHLVEEAAEWIADILDVTTNVRVLATSRAPLMIPAERVYQLDALASAGADGEDTPGPAVTLFVERARAARPSAALPLDTVARLCDRLDGLPLAIELAAARVRSMSVDEIERRIGNRFALLRGGDRTAPERHRTLLAVIDWSWNLLGGSERRTLRRLSRFVDGFGADAAQRVAADGPDDVTDDLEALVNQSLVTVAENEATGELRYRLLETVREFGEMALVDAGEDVAVRDAMLRWASEFSVRMGHTDFGSEQIATFRTVGVEQENLVAALRVAIELRRCDVVVDVFGCLGYHWSVRGAHSEVFAFSDPIVGVLRGYNPDDDHLDTTVASYALITGTQFYASPRGWARPLGRLRKLMRERRPSDPRIAAMADLLLAVGNLDRVTRILAQIQRSSDPGTASFGYMIDAQLKENAGDIAGAMVLCNAGYEASTAAEDAWSQGMAAQSLAQLYSQTARPDAAVEWAMRARPSLESLQASDDLRQLDWLVAINRVAAGDLEAARPPLEFLAYADHTEVGVDSTDLRAIGTAGLAELAIAEGDLDSAVRFYRTAAAVFDDQAKPGAPWFLAIGAGAVAVAVRAGLADDPHTIADLRKLRVRLLVSYRTRPGFIDHPITGASLLGLAIWLLAPDRVGATDAERESGWELLALARGLSCRQDFPALNWQRAADEAVATHAGERALQRAIARVDAMSMAERAECAFDRARDQRAITVTPSS